MTPVDRFPKKTFRLVAGVLLLIGLGIGSVSVYLTIDAREFTHSAVKTEGKVLRLEWHTSRDNKGRTTRMAAPVVQFFADGTSHEFASQVSSSNPSFNPGDTVPVLYLPDAPNRARIGTFGQLYLGAIITGIIAFVFGGMGVLFLVLVWYLPRRLESQRNGDART